MPKKERKEKMKNSGGNIKRVYRLNKRNFLISSLLIIGVFMITLGGLFSSKTITNSLRSLFDENQKYHINTSYKYHQLHLEKIERLKTSHLSKEKPICLSYNPNYKFYFHKY